MTEQSPDGARQQEPAARRRLRPRGRGRSPPTARAPATRWTSRSCARSSTAASSRRATPRWPASPTPSPPRGSWSRSWRARSAARASSCAIPIRAPMRPTPGRAAASRCCSSTAPSSTARNVDLPFGLGDFAGADTLVAALEQCRRDATVAAVVLRVNSPGGSAFASDVVAREIKSLRAAGKPIVVSMGDLAASGGYYIAAPADVIYAEPSTLSGSIGVFGYKVDAQKLLGTLGINVETYRRGAHADFLSPYRPWTDGGARARRAADPPPLPAVRRHRRRGARRPRPHRRARRRARAGARLDRRARAGAGPRRPDGRPRRGDRRGGAPRRRAARARPAPRPGAAARRQPRAAAPAGRRGVGARRRAPTDSRRRGGDASRRAGRRHADARPAC